MYNEHGGDIYSYKVETDFSVNTSPFGVPSEVIEAGKAAFANVSAYPDTRCRALKKAIAEYEGVSAENIICGNGAADIIFTLAYALRPHKALVLAPTFSEYERALFAAECETEFYTLSEDNDFKITEDILNCITPSTDAVFVCNPNNPTGVVTERDMLSKILKRCTQCGTLLVLDESFNDFVLGGEQLSLAKRAGNDDNLLVLKSFTKLYSIPSIRLGYAICGNRTLLEQMERARQPWSVSGIAQAMGIEALKHTDTSQLKAYIAKEKLYLYNCLDGLGFKYIPSEANYILFKAYPDLARDLLQKGILIRDLSSCRGMGDGWYRIAIKTHSENERLITAMGGV